MLHVSLGIHVHCEAVGWSKSTKLFSAMLVLPSVSILSSHCQPALVQDCTDLGHSCLK